MANRTVTVFKSYRRGALLGTGSCRSFQWTYTPGSGAEDQNVTGVTWDGKNLIFCTDEPNPALGTSARFVVIDVRTGSILRVINAGVISDGGLRDICWDGKYIWGLDYYANDAVPLCAISKYDRKTGVLIRRLATGLSTNYWSITWDGKNILAIRTTNPQCYVDVFDPRNGNIVASKIMLNVLDYNLSFHEGIGWDGRNILSKQHPTYPFAPGLIAMIYQAQDRRNPDAGAGVLAANTSTATTAPRAGEARGITWDGMYLYDFTQV
jgi:hypothetical protein